MGELAPTYTAGLFRPLHAELVGLLRSLGGDDWERPTLARRWKVRDVVAHLLDGDLRRLSFHRDGHPLPPPPAPIRGPDDLVSFLDALNAEWIMASMRLSPTVLVELIDWSGGRLADFVEGLDPGDPALFPVAWAGEDAPLNWMDVGREYTERWHHQQQIREAVGRPLLLEACWMAPLLELSVRALPPAFAGMEAGPGTEVSVEITGEGGGEWTVRRAADGSWTISEGAAASPRATVHLSTDVAWRLFYNADLGAAADEIRVDGDEGLAAPVLRARSVMVRGAEP